MRSLKHHILILLLGSLVVLAGGFLLVLGFHMKDSAVASSMIKAQTDLATSREIIDKTYPGPWSEQDGSLYKGPVKISLNNDLVDHLSNLTGNTVTLFLGETRVATTVRGSNGERAIGTKVSANVAQTVLKDGQTYIGEADVLGQSYQTAYVPLRAENGDIIGIFYVGVSQAYEQQVITQSLITMAKLGLGLTILVAFISWFFIRKVIINPLKSIMLGTKELASGHLTQKMTISSAREIGELEDAFTQMVEKIQSLTEEVNRATSKDVENLSTIIKESAPEAIAQPTVNTDGAIVGVVGLPKGLQQATLDQIVQFLHTNRRPLSAEEVAEGVKLTRVTVRRYLEYLEHSGKLKSEQKYGTVGRPVKLFLPI